VAIGWADVTSTVVSVTDSAGNTYLPATSVTQNPDLGSTQIYYAPAILPSASNSVTVEFSDPVLWPDVRILEYSGLAATNPVDAWAGNSGYHATASSGMVTTTNPTDLLFAENYVGSEITAGPGTNFAMRLLTAPDDYDIAEDAIVTAAGSYNARAVLSTRGDWVMQAVAFKAAQ